MQMVVGRKQASERERGLDCCDTPAETVEALLAHKRLAHSLWEPACGPRARVRVLRQHGHEVYATDLKDCGCPDSLSRIDFLMEALAAAGIDAITSAPYMIANASWITRSFWCRASTCCCPYNSLRAGSSLASWCSVSACR